MFELLAQTAPTADPQQPPQLIGMIVQYLPLIAVVVLMYFFIFRAKRNEDKKRQQMINELKKGDRVQTIGGILGTVLQTDGDEITVKVDESNNTKIRFTRSAVHKVINADSAKTDSK